MVRHGSLSKGCQTCRKRKIKCDQLKPACTQCLKAGWRCPQYEDTVDRMFQHHNPGIPERAPPESRGGVKDARLSKALLAQAEATQPSCGVPVGTTDECLELISINIPTEITFSINHIAVEFFFATHTFQDDGILRGFYEYLPALAVEARTNRMFTTSLNAVALAAYAHTSKQLSLLHDAKQFYGRAFRLVNSALTVPMQAVQDSTIVSILLLSTFDTLMYGDKVSLAHNESHLRGTMIILKLRGLNIMRTRRGLQIFLHMCSCLFLNCIMRSVAIPADLIKLRSQAGPFLDVDNPYWRLSGIMARVATFRAEVRNHTLHDPALIIATALEVDRELASLCGTMCAKSHYETIPTQMKTDLVFGPSFHRYSDRWVASIWNYIRGCRLLLHREIRRQLPSVPDSQLLADYSSHILHQLSLDICATIPQFCGHISYLFGCEPSAGAKNVGFGMAPCVVPGFAGVYFLSWPLVTAGECTDSSTQKQWIIDRCRYIGRETGIQQGFAIADMLARGEQIQF